MAWLAARQHGVVAHGQLVALGLSRSAIQRRLRAGRLHGLHTGVYAVGHPLVSEPGRWIAAVLACGPGAVLSHRCAAAHLGILPGGPLRVDVTVPCGSRRNRPGIRVHRTRRLDPEDRATAEGIPVTTVARTLLDVAEAAPRDVDRALEASERLRVFDRGAVEEVVARNPGRRGLRPLGRALDAYRPAPVTRSELERRFLRLCQGAGLPRPQTNVRLAGHEVDAVWHDRRLVVELDSSWHATSAAFERDRIRDAALQLAGYRVVRVTHRRLKTGRAEVLSVLRALLAQPPPGAAAR